MIRSKKIQYEEAVTDVFETDVDDLSMEQNNLIGCITRQEGIAVQKSVTLTGNDATTENLFQITGTVKLAALYGVCTSVTDATTFSLVKFELDDGTAQVDLTSTVDGSGIVAGSVLKKDAVAANALGLIDSSAGAVDEGSFQEIFVTQKTGSVDTFVRLSYTGDATTDVTITFVALYVPMTDTSDLEAVA